MKPELSSPGPCVALKLLSAAPTLMWAAKCRQGEEVEEATYKANGTNAQLELSQDEVSIERKGMEARAKGARGRIPIRQIASVELQEPGRMGTGYIQFVLGGQKAANGHWAAGGEPTTVVFSTEHAEEMKALKEAVEQRIAERQGPAEVPAGPVSGEKLPRALAAASAVDPKTFEVEGLPGAVLAMVREFFESDEWPYPVARTHQKVFWRSKGVYDLSGPGGLSGAIAVKAGGMFGVPATADKVSAILPRRNMLHSFSGTLMWCLLTLLTFGIFPWVYLAWVLLFRPPVIGRVDVTAAATPATPHRTVVEVRAGPPEPGQPVEEWIQRELIENRAAAGMETPQSTERVDRLRRFVQNVENTAAQAEENRQPSDVPDQIRKLADLRDTGALTDEEFEAKKKDLLDRM